jgi:hypothetical protein
MEDYDGAQYNWSRWSSNRAAQCDVLVTLYANRIGTIDKYFLAQNGWSLVKIEESYSAPWRIKAVAYRLERPFPDQERLFLPQEQYDYERSLQEEDSRGSAPLALWAEQAHRDLREPITVRSVDDLVNRLRQDLRVSRLAVLRHRIKTWRRTYFNTNDAAWRRAIADESHVASTSRVGFRWRLRPYYLAAVAVWLGTLYVAASLRGALTITAVFVVLAFLVILAYAPTYVWVGTRSVVARGAFALKTIQDVAEPVFIEAKWRFLEESCGIGAILAKCSSGQRVFVPLVNDPSAIVREMEKRHSR